MACRKQYSAGEMERFDELSKLAVAILQGASIESCAKERNCTMDEVNAMIEEIKAVNPFLYQQIQEKITN